MQRKSTNGISLIRASGSLPPKRRRRQLTISAWPGQSSRVCGDGEQGQMRPVPNAHSLSLPHPFTHKQNEEVVRHGNFEAEDMTWRSGEIIIAFLRSRMAPYDIRAARGLAAEKSRGTNAFLRAPSLSSQSASEKAQKICKTCVACETGILL